MELFSKPLAFHATLIATKAVIEAFEYKQRGEYQPFIETFRKYQNNTNNIQDYETAFWLVLGFISHHDNHRDGGFWAGMKAYLAEVETNFNNTHDLLRSLENTVAWYHHYPSQLESVVQKRLGNNRPEGYVQVHEGANFIEMMLKVLCLKHVPVVTPQGLGFLQDLNTEKQYLVEVKGSVTWFKSGQVKLIS